MTEFRTHKGEIVSGERIQDALETAANDWAGLAIAIREEDAYASHVTEETKDADMVAMIERAEEMRRGGVRSFTIWQRVNEVLTGECVAFLP